jgi:hypothetical protein
MSRNCATIFTMNREHVRFGTIDNAAHVSPDGNTLDDMDMQGAANV